MIDKIDLSQHISLTSADSVDRIVKPLTEELGIKHFRYLKLYNDGSRILLSNYPDCSRFFYELGHYKKTWFDGEFPQHLNEGWHLWDVMRVINLGGEITPFEREINEELGLYHGITYVSKCLGYYEIFSFDSSHSNIYQIHYGLLQHFILYFKEQAKKLIDAAASEKIKIPRSENLLQYQLNKDKFTTFLENTRIKRYYLTGKYSDVYLTAKEVQCVYWLAQGKTAEEVSMIENTSVRTVEGHLGNIRRKLNCYSKSQIVRILLEVGFLDYAQFFYHK